MENVRLYESEMERGWIPEFEKVDKNVEQNVSDYGQNNLDLFMDSVVYFKIKITNKKMIISWCYYRTGEYGEEEIFYDILHQKTVIYYCYKSRDKDCPYKLFNDFSVIDVL